MRRNLFLLINFLDFFLLLLWLNGLLNKKEEIRRPSFSKRKQSFCQCLFFTCLESFALTDDILSSKNMCKFGSVITLCVSIFANLKSFLKDSKNRLSSLKPSFKFSSPTLKKFSLIWFCTLSLKPQGESYLKISAH